MVELAELIESLVDKKEKLIKSEQFEKVLKVKEKLANAQAEFDTLRATEMDREDMEEYVYTRALTIAEQLLSGTRKTLHHAGIAGLLDALLLPAIFQSANPQVRSNGLRCLGIYCLLDR
jgi:hypothetical protein